MLSRKALWTRRWKTHWRQETLVMTKESSPMMTCDDKGVFTDDEAHTGNTSNLRWVGGWKETGCRRGGCHMGWLSVWYWISSLCLIIKGLDNQRQKLNYQINQYPRKSSIVILAVYVSYQSIDRPTSATGFLFSLPHLKHREKSWSFHFVCHP
jgi:hypothetical protein